VCNDSGEVIGLTTFGSIENNGFLAAGLNFSIPVSILKDFMDTANVVPALSRASALFAEGIVCFNKQYYRKALGSFEEVKKLNSTYPTADYYINNCKAKIENGEDKSGRSIKFILLSSVMLLLAVVLYMRYRR
jgi:serine protease Do